MTSASHLRIRNHELLSGIFGEWPSFHDAEVLKMALNRQERELLVSIYLFRMTNEIDANGYYVLADKVVATLRFTGITELQLRDFNHQNVLWELGIRDVSADQLEDIHFEVRLESSFGLEGSFRCDSIEVASVEPYEPVGAGVQSAADLNGSFLSGIFHGGGQRR